MEFDTKIKIILANDLLPWQELNVTAFLMSGIAGTQNIIGEPYADKNGRTYLPMSQQPIMIYSGSREEIKALHEKALGKEVVMTIFTEELFGTFNDADNRASVAQFPTEGLHLVGLGIRGKKTHVDKLFKGLKLHA